MESSAFPTNKETAAKIAVVGGGPAGLVAAIALARRGIRTTVFERDEHPELAPRFNPDRSYGIDITGHGLRALRHIDACDYFDQKMLQFKGFTFFEERTDEWSLPGWTGSRGDIMRTLMGLVEEKYSEWISCEFECSVTSVDVLAGSLTYEFKSNGMQSQQFDLIIGSDGTGSVVRKAMVEQIPGFTVEVQSYPSYSTMIELDRVGNQWDKHYVYAISDAPICVAGAIPADKGLDSVRWSAIVGSTAPLEFSSTAEAQQFLADRVPRMLELTSEEQIAAFAQRDSSNIGRTLTCSQIYGGKAVLLGDAAGAFPPIGQGGNAALESGTIIDLCIGEVGNSPAQLLEAAKLYDTRWKPEVDAITWITRKSLVEKDSPFSIMHASKPELRLFHQAKSVEIPYSEVRRKAEQLLQDGLK